MMRARCWRRIGSSLLLAGSLLLGAGAPLHAAPCADLRAEVLYQDMKRQAKPCGMAQRSDGMARLDVRLGKAGDFVLLADMEAKTLRVFSQRLKAYVEFPIIGDPHDWRDIVKSASTAVMPQTLGMVSIEEKSREVLGHGSFQGYRAEKNRSVFELGFMGSLRRVTLLSWDSDELAPFPLKVQVVPSQDTREGIAWLSDIVSECSPEQVFMLPEGATRYTSIMDLLLYALTAF
ncbi:MAG: hypothetical protein IKJ34_01870 [Mailhella sp.]|nr:hypothetical protein [Mailhella sp.]